MDIFSYLLGKKSAGGGITPSGTINIIDNGNYDVTSYANASVNVPKSATFKVPNNLCFGCSREIPSNLDFSETTDFREKFKNCNQIDTIPQIDTSKGTNFEDCFRGCGWLQNFPVLDFSNMTQNYNMFAGCSQLLGNESLNNILLSLSRATKVNSSWKTLQRCGFTSQQATICQSLSNYQVFLDAGWTTGY